MKRAYLQNDDSLVPSNKKSRIEDDVILPNDIIIEILAFHQIVIDFKHMQDEIPLLSILYGYFLNDPNRNIQQFFHHIALRDTKDKVSYFNIEVRERLLMSVQEKVFSIGNRLQSLEISTEGHMKIASVENLSKNLKKLWLHGIDLTNTDVEWIMSNCIHLTHLSIDADISLNDRLLQNTKMLSKLKVLDLSAHKKMHRIDPELLNLSSLKELSLPFTKVDNKFLGGIFASKSIKKLELKGLMPKCNLTDVLVAQSLLSNTTLRKLRVWENLFTNNGSQILSQCAHLRHIVLACKSKQHLTITELLRNTPLAQSLTSMTLDIGKVSGPIANLICGHVINLKTLSFLGCRFDNEAFEAISLHPNISRLMIHGGVDDQGANILLKNTRLTSLILRNDEFACDKITDAGVKLIPLMPRLYELNLESTDVTDEGIAHIANSTSLRSLNISNTRFTVEGLINTFKNNDRIFTLVHGKFKRGKEKLVESLPHIQLLQSEYQ